MKNHASNPETKGEATIRIEAIDALDEAGAKLGVVMRLLSGHDCTKNDFDGIGASDVTVARSVVEGIQLTVFNAAHAIRGASSSETGNGKSRRHA
jgi:hypothetical protein